MSRKLTKFFGSYTLDQYTAKTGKGLLDIIDVGDLNISSIIDLAELGNKGMKREDVCDKIDTYLAASDDNSYVSVYFDLLKEFDMDTKLLRASGVKVQDLIDDYNNKLKEERDAINKKIESTVNSVTEQEEKQVENINDAL